MSDSEGELSHAKVFGFRNRNMTVSARGPNTNLSNISFRSQMASSMCMPRNFERQRYAESMSDQRSMYYRRETSPMSIHSAYDSRPRNFQPYYNGMGSQSVFNGRSGSPMSMRSIESNASVSAADIAFAFQNAKFNKYDLRLIKEAYNKLMKHRSRKRIEKRRNLRLFLKGNRYNRSGDDSSDRGSNSSDGSVDRRSVKTSYQENMFSSRSGRIDLADFKKTVKDSNMVKDCTDSFRNVFSVNTSSFNRNPRFNNSSVSKQNQSIATQKHRFENGFLLPSQRFNRSVASSVILEDSERQHKNKELNYREKEINCVANNNKQNKNGDSSSETEIFSEVTNKDNCNLLPQRKRSINNDELNLPDKKKSKLSSSIQQVNKKAPVNINDENSNKFEFAKPMFPARKSKTKVQETIIAKSKQPLTGFVDPPVIITNNIESVKTTNITNEKVADGHDNENETHEVSDTTMRPSFIKRKLFTQNLDVAEKANTSSDTSNSPQNMYSALQKEKNKARKLVQSQSCLNREVQEDNNLLDLIHKIVPPDRINVTTSTIVSQTKTDVNISDKKEDDDKWDVTSVISLCNDNDVSDTFTDDEIFKTKPDKKDSNKNKKVTNTVSNDTEHSSKDIQNNILNQSKNCRIVIKDLHLKQKLQENQGTIKNTNININNIVKKTYVKSFWDMDSESDIDCDMTKRRNLLKEKLTTGTVPKLPAPSQTVPETPCNTSTTRPVRTSRGSTVKNQQPLQEKLHNKTKTYDNSGKLNITIISHRSHRAPKAKAPVETELKSNKAIEPVKNITSTKKMNIQEKVLPKSKTQNSADTVNNNIKSLSSNNAVKAKIPVETPSKKCTVKTSKGSAKKNLKPVKEKKPGQASKKTKAQENTEVLNISINNHRPHRANKTRIPLETPVKSKRPVRTSRGSANKNQQQVLVKPKIPQNKSRTDDSDLNISINSLRSHQNRSRAKKGCNESLCNGITTKKRETPVRKATKSKR